MKNYCEIANNWIERVRVYGLSNSIVLFNNHKKKGIFSLKINGRSFLLRGNSVDFTVLNSIFARKEYEITLDINPEIIVDAGANIGASTVFFRTKFPQAKILAIEPEPSNFELLSKNTASYPGILLEKSAIWHENANLLISNPNAENYAFQMEATRGADMGIRGVTIINLMERWNLPQIDILKLDIEGAERYIFNAPIPWLDRVHLLIIELHETLYPGTTEIFHKALRGFKCEIFQKGENYFVLNNSYET